jgi:hypothetical protein
MSNDSNNGSKDSRKKTTPPPKKVVIQPQSTPEKRSDSNPIKRNK